MSPLSYDLLLVALSALLSWLTTDQYYRKSLRIQDREHTRERAALIQALESKSAMDSTLLKQKHIDAVVEAWKKYGTPEHYLASLGVSNEEKAEIFRSACLRHKRREPKRNPYVE